MGAIVLGYDASPGARSALECAVDLAREHGDELVIAYGVAPPGGVGEEWKENRAALEDQARAHTAEALAEAEQAGLTARSSWCRSARRPRWWRWPMPATRASSWWARGARARSGARSWAPRRTSCCTFPTARLWWFRQPDIPYPMLKEFREFILRGNLVDLAIAVVIGTAFAVVIAAFVTDLVTPLIAAVGGEPSFDDLTFTINGSEFRYGHFINALLTFVIIAAVVFFLVVKPVNALMARMKTGEDVEEETHKCPECRSDIPVSARRCAFCTAQVQPAA